MTDLLPGFDERLVDVGDVRIRARCAGFGPPVLMLHGYPQTLVMWHRVAQVLAAGFTVVLADLRGNGGSSKPVSTDDHATYARRAMANDRVRLMERLGHQRFAVIGHDRGGRVAHRLALDHPERVAGVAVLDIVPTLHMFDNVDRAMAASYFHWFFLAQPGGLPERLIGADPDAWFASRFRGRHRGPAPFEPEALDEYRNSFRDPATIAATCADYRAAASIDLEHDRADRAAGRRITAPLLALWGQESHVGRNFAPGRVWELYADSVTATALDADHYLVEEAPAATSNELRRFLARTFVAG